jgi:hypothetical protein
VRASACLTSGLCLPLAVVLQVYRQTNTEHVSYPEAIKRVIAEDGFAGLMGRGLTTKIFANGMQVTT